MCNDTWGISYFRILNHTSGRRLLFVAVFLLLVSCFCVPCFATGAEILEYEDVFNDSNSIAVVRISRQIRYYVDDIVDDTVSLDDYYQTTITENQIAIFSQTEWNDIVTSANFGNGVDAYSKLDVVIDVDLVYRHYIDDSAVFPIENVKSFSISHFHAFCNLSSTSVPDSWTLGGYKYSVPGSSVVSEGTGNSSTGTYIISLYVPGSSDRVFYHNSIQLKNFYGTFTYEASSFSRMQIPTLEFSFSNIYQYTLNSVETTQEPVTPDSGFVPGVDTVIPSDTMQGHPDDIDNVLDDRYQDFVNNYTDILNGFSWVKYASCFGFIGQFFGKVFQFEPFSDILNAWAIFAVFNILLGGFITGVSAIVRHHVSRENKEKDKSDRNSKGGDK